MYIRIESFIKVMMILGRNQIRKFHLQQPLKFFFLHFRIYYLLPHTYNIEHENKGNDI